MFGFAEVRFIARGENQWRGLIDYLLSEEHDCCDAYLVIRCDMHWKQELPFKRAFDDNGGAMKKMLVMFRTHERFSDLYKLDRNFKREHDVCDTFHWIPKRLVMMFAVATERAVCRQFMTKCASLEKGRNLYIELFGHWIMKELEPRWSACIGYVDNSAMESNPVKAGNPYYKFAGRDEAPPIKP
jgi:hypothetical protein